MKQRSIDGYAHLITAPLIPALFIAAIIAAAFATCDSTRPDASKPAATSQSNFARKLHPMQNHARPLFANPRDGFFKGSRASRR
jgi:hypothetical protein